MFTLVLTEDEAKALLQLIDLAVKSAGLNVAEAAGVLARKISTAGAAAEADRAAAAAEKVEPEAVNPEPATPSPDLNTVHTLPADA